MEEIAPRLRTVVPHITPVGCEDSEEMYQDGLATAAKMLNDLEQRGKTGDAWECGLLRHAAPEKRQEKPQLR